MVGGGHKKCGHLPSFVQNTKIYAYFLEQEKAADRDKGERLRLGCKRSFVEIYTQV